MAIRETRLSFGISTSVLVFLAAFALLGAAREQRPFWTEKSAFVEGDDLFVVGVATKAQTSEAGRQHAFEHGRQELMNYAQVTNLEAQGLVIDTQMTYEEPNQDGTITVFRLLRIPAAKLVEIQRRMRSQSLVQEQALDLARDELARAQQSLVQKQQELETKSRALQDTLKAVSQLQVSLTEKAQKIEQQQRQVEELLAQLTAKIRPSKPQEAAHTGHAPLGERLKEAEANLEGQKQELAQIALRIRKRIDQETENVQKRCGHLSRGMTTEDVKTIMGRNPDSHPLGELGTPLAMPGVPWEYRGRDSVVLEFSRAGSLERIQGCSTHERPSRR